MITLEPRALDHPTEQPALDRARRKRKAKSASPAGRERVSTDSPARPMASSFSRDLRRIRATWTSEHGSFELAVGSHATGLQIKLCTWLHGGTALEECFVIHSRTEFEQWITRSPTKFDHPVAHEEVKRFAHGYLSR